MVHNILVIAGVIALSSCSGTQFGGESGKKSGGSNLTGSESGEGKAAKKDGGPGGGATTGPNKAGVIGPDSSTATGTDDPNGTDDNEKGEITDQTTSEASGVAGESGVSSAPVSSGINAECLSKKAKEYNIAIVIDASGSQKSTDPKFLRERASKNLAIEMARTGRVYPGLSIEIGVVGFSSKGIVGINGPQDVGKNGADKVSADITQVSHDLGGGTNFEAGLKVAEASLVLMGAQKGVSTQRNYIIFLTDGEPTSSDSPGNNLQVIDTKVRSMVTNFDVAMITVASGSQIKQKGIDVVQGMALPKVGTISPEHVGKYIRADTDKALGEVSTLLGSIISDCKK